MNAKRPRPERASTVSSFGFVDLAVVLVVAVFLGTTTEPPGLVPLERENRGQSGIRCCIAGPARILVAPSGVVPQKFPGSISAENYLRTMFSRRHCAANSVLVDLHPDSTAGRLVEALDLVRRIHPEARISVVREHV